MQSAAANPESVPLLAHRALGYELTAELLKLGQRSCYKLQRIFKPLDMAEETAGENSTNHFIFFGPETPKYRGAE